MNKHTRAFIKLLYWDVILLNQVFKNTLKTQIAYIKLQNTHTSLLYYNTFVRQKLTIMLNL